MKLKKLSLRQLFSNTKFLVVFSILVAFIFWIVVALEYAPVIENEINMRSNPWDAAGSLFLTFSALSKATHSMRERKELCLKFVKLSVI